MSFEFISRIGLLILLCTIQVFVFTAGTAVVCLMAGVKLTNIQIFFGKPVFIIPTRFAPVYIGYIPAGGGVTLDMDEFPRKPRSTRCLVAIAGPIAVLLSSLICLGPTHCWLSFVSTYSQIVQFVIAPFSDGKELISHFLLNAQLAPVKGYGIFAAKIVALYFIPMPSMPGVRLLLDMTNMSHSPIALRVSNYVQSIVAVCVVGWIIVVTVRYFLH